MRKKAILIVESSPELRDLLTAALARRYAVEITGSFTHAMAECRHPRHAALVVDIVRGGADDEAIQLIQQIRAGGDERPVVALSGVRDPELPSWCYEAGADAYVPKTGCTIRELRAVLARLLSRSHENPPHPRVDGILLPASEFRFSGAVINPVAMTASFPAGTVIDLNPKELGILHVLATNSGRLVRRAEILAHVWGPEAVPTSKTLDTYLVRLRRAYQRGGIDLAQRLKAKPKVGWWVGAERNVEKGTR